MQEFQNSTGNPPSSLPIYKHLFNFIDDVLLDFKPLSKTNKGYTVTSEDDITEDLADYLDLHHTNNTFKFINQSKQDKYKTDIGVRFGRTYEASNRPLFCWIEAKRLPTPREKDRDEREYVIVSQGEENGQKKFKGNGGIQRFKENQHAPNLPYSIMIGYIQENDAKYWLNKINEWIRQLIIENSLFWSDEDCLCKQELTKCEKYLSIHNRKDKKSPIIIHHFWIDLK